MILSIIFYILFLLPFIFSVALAWLFDFNIYAVFGICAFLSSYITKAGIYMKMPRFEKPVLYTSNVVMAQFTLLSILVFITSIYILFNNWILFILLLIIPIVFRNIIEKIYIFIFLKPLIRILEK